MRGGLTIDIFIPKGVLKEPSAITKLFWFLGSNPIVFLPLVTLAVMFGLWHTVGKDPDPGVSVAPMYEPPKGLTPAEAGTLIDDSTDPRDITSTIVDLAVRGYIKIEEKIETFLVFKKKDYTLYLLKPREQWGTDLCPHERVMLENIFAGGSETKLSSLKNRFYTAVPVVRTDIMSALKQKGIGPSSIASELGIGRASVYRALAGQPATSVEPPRPAARAVSRKRPETTTAMIKRVTGETRRKRQAASHKRAHDKRTK